MARYTNNMKTLIVYYSAQWHTKAIAEKVAKELNADLFEVKPAEDYSEADLDWTDGTSRVYREHKDESLRKIALENTDVPGWSEYERVIVMYPIWWSVAAWPLSSFVTSVDFSNKTVYPVAVSHSSPLGKSGEALASAAKGGNWQEGIRFSQDAGEAEIKKWTDSL